MSTTTSATPATSLGSPTAVLTAAQAVDLTLAIVQNARKLMASGAMTSAQFGAIWSTMGACLTQAESLFNSAG